MIITASVVILVVDVILVIVVVCVSCYLSCESQEGFLFGVFIFLWWDVVVAVVVSTAANCLGHQKQK